MCTTHQRPAAAPYRSHSHLTSLGADASSRQRLLKAPRQLSGTLRRALDLSGPSQASRMVEEDKKLSALVRYLSRIPGSNRVDEIRWDRLENSGRLLRRYIKVIEVLCIPRLPATSAATAGRGYF